MPASVSSTKAGTGTTAGRCSSSPSRRANSRLVVALGAETLYTSREVGLVARCVAARSQSSSEMVEKYWSPLSYRAAETGLEHRPQHLDGSATAVEHDSAAHHHDTRPGALGCLRGGLPLPGDPADERVCVVRRLLGQDDVTPVAVPGDAVLRHQRRLAVGRGDRLGEGAGGRDPAGDEGALVAIGPRPVRQRRPRQAGDHVGVLDDRPVDLAGVRVPARLARGQRLAAHEPHDLVSLTSEVVTPGGAEEAGAAGEHDSHRSNVPRKTQVIRTTDSSRTYRACGMSRGCHLPRCFVAGEAWVPTAARVGSGGEA